LVGGVDVEGGLVADRFRAVVLADARREPSARVLAARFSR
jgi:hypothetical protein